MPANPAVENRPSQEVACESAGRPAERKEGGLIAGNASLAVWLIFLCFGGALLLLYYIDIGYFPDLMWEEALTYLAALSLLGGAVALLYSLLLFFPGVIWAEFLIHDTELEDKLCYRAGDHVEACYWSVGLHVGLPFGVFMIAMHFVAHLGIWKTLIAAGFMLLPISDFLARRFRQHLEEKKSLDRQLTDAGPRSLVLKYVSLFDVSALISLASLLLLYAIADPNAQSWQMFIVCTLVVVVANFLVAVQFRRRPGRATVTAIVFALVLLACGEGLAGPGVAISRRLMDLLGFGDVPVTLVVKPEGREILREHGIQPSCELPTGIILGDARILSRLGKQYFIKVGSRRVAIPRELVLSWSAAAEPEGTQEPPRLTPLTQIPRTVPDSSSPGDTTASTALLRRR